MRLEVKVKHVAAVVLFSRTKVSSSMATSVKFALKMGLLLAINQRSAKSARMLALKML
jgi:hypothetical protein